MTALELKNDIHKYVVETDDEDVLLIVRNRFAELIAQKSNNSVQSDLGLDESEKTELKK